MKYRYIYVFTLNEKQVLLSVEKGKETTFPNVELDNFEDPFEIVVENFQKLQFFFERPIILGLLEREEVFTIILLVRLVRVSEENGVYTKKIKYIQTNIFF